MIHPIFRIETYRCTTKVVEAFNSTMDYIKTHYSEFITPEHLLYHFCQQEPFQAYCEDIQADVQGMQEELHSFLEQIGYVPEENECLVLPSIQLQMMSDEVNGFWEGRNTNGIQDDDSNPLSVSDFILAMYHLKDSFAHYVLDKYFQSKDLVDICRGMDFFYMSDLEMYQYIKDDSNSPHHLAETYFGGTKEEFKPVDNKEILKKMMASANRLMGALNQLDDKIKNSAKQKREPWEELVTCINDTYRFRNPLIGRQKELERAIRILCRKDKNNPIFVGEPGVGKTVMVYGLAREIEHDNVPEWLRHQRIYALDMATMVAGASYHGEFEKRFKAVLEGAKARGNCILYIDDIHTIVETGGGNQSMNAGELLKPYLEEGTVRFIGCTTYQDYNKSIAKKKSIARRFGLIDVKEPTPEETYDILYDLLPIYEGHHGVRYDEEAVRYAVQQSDSLIHDRFLPDKAIDIIDEAGAYRQQHPLLNKKGLPKAARYQKVDKALIRQILTDVCRIDAKALASDSADANENLRSLGKRISQDIYGQDEAIQQVTRAVMMSKAGLMEPGKPIASLLFVGPTGVGKTEVCRVLARELGVELVRFDMSEYTEKHSVSKLIGSPAGYVGYDEGGQLTDAIRKTPNCVLLLDEIEKAHTDIYNILLQVMDYARLTDNKGNKADFRNVILIMTSNAGAQFAAQAGIGFSGGQTKGQAMLQAVKKTFKPEFLNRLSGTVVFNEMDRQMASLILDKKLCQLKQRLESRGVTLTLSDEAHELLLQEGFTHQYGAREMDRVINHQLTPLLMEELLFGKLRKGGEAQIAVDKGQLILAGNK